MGANRFDGQAFRAAVSPGESRRPFFFPREGSMVQDSAPPRFLTHQERLVEYFQSFTPAQRKVLSELYDVGSVEGEAIAQCWLKHPERVLEVIRQKVKGSLGWRVIEETAMEHDLGLDLQWVPARQRRELERLGVFRILKEEHGGPVAMMPAAVAALLAGHIKGQRGSLILLLGKESSERIDELAGTWGLEGELSRVEKILELSNHFSGPDAIDEILEMLPTPDWIGDAMMVMELGGLCFWQQIYGYDLENGPAGGENVVPLMRRDERRHQQAVAEALQDLGVLFRMESEELEYPMVAVPEELWMGFWDLGLQWLTEWVVQALEVLDEVGLGGAPVAKRTSLQGIWKWLLCEAESERLRWKGEFFAPESLEVLEEVYVGESEADWEKWWQLGLAFRLFWPEKRRGKKDQGRIARGIEAEVLLDRSRQGFFRECLLEWCVGYYGQEADRKLGEALGIDETWRERALPVMETHSDMIPAWMHHPGVDSSTTGGGWLREPESGTEQMVLFEAVIASTFVVSTKLSWLDLLSLLEGERYYPVSALVELLQCCASVSMFTQLGVVLGQQPAAVYLPFQRSSFLMDAQHQARVQEWVEDLFDHLLVPLGVASYSEDRQSVSFEPLALRIQNPPGWPEEERERFIADVCGEEESFSIPDGRDGGLRQVAVVPGREEKRVSAEVPLKELLALGKERVVECFDGKVLIFDRSVEGSPGD